MYKFDDAGTLRNIFLEHSSNDLFFAALGDMCAEKLCRRPCVQCDGDSYHYLARECGLVTSEEEGRTNLEMEEIELWTCERPGFMKGPQLT